MTDIRIVQLDKAFSYWTWICQPHLTRRKALGFQVKANNEPPHEGLTCDDCHFSEPITIPPKGDAT